MGTNNSLCYTTGSSGPGNKTNKCVLDDYCGISPLQGSRRVHDEDKTTGKIIALYYELCVKLVICEKRFFDMQI